ncbi:succinate dehydrogenase iron-sulfur subunit [bacterium]|nr:succinate dehydrogenase iron-sulfur subunit [candidate division CSSED10-310 bacterium]
MIMSDTSFRNIPFTVFRYNPQTDATPHVETYTVKVQSGMTVLDGLHQIKSDHDASLSWRYSCRMGVCGSCGMLINGRAMLACNTQILDVSTIAIAVAPLPNFPVIRDLVPDLESMFVRHKEIKPWIIRKDESESDRLDREYSQSPEQLEAYLQFSYCIKCGCCMAACPTMATDAEYLGPQPLAQAYRYEADSRDQGFEERKPILDKDSGLFSCHYGSECSVVCPKGVDPAKAIQLMKRQMVLDLIGLRRKKCSGLHHG